MLHSKNVTFDEMKEWGNVKESQKLYSGIFSKIFEINILFTLAIGRPYGKPLWSAMISIWIKLHA